MRSRARVEELRARVWKVPARPALWLLVWMVLFAPFGAALAGTTGKISGVVKEKGGAALPGATVQFVGLAIGALSDRDGHYDILNVSPGTYRVTVSYIGYKTVTVENVVVSSDLTTHLDLDLETTTLAVEEIVVSAERPIVDVNITSSRATLSSREIESLPVQELQDVVNLQAGVVDGHFRGGRLGEVQYQVDGVSSNNAFDNKQTVKLDRSVLQEVQVISGTFDAEYGQAMSGVVNAVLKEGSAKFEWSAEAYAGGFVFPGREARLTDDELRPSGLQNYQISASGPTQLPGTIFLASARRSLSDGFVTAYRLFAPTDSSDFEHKVFRPTGDGKKVPLSYSEDWSGVVKITNHSLANTKLSYSAIFGAIDARRGSWAYALNPDGMPVQKTHSLVHGMDWTQTLNEDTFLSTSIRQNYVRYTDRVYEDAYDPRYDEAGPAIGDPDFANNAILQGVDFTRYRQRTNTLVVESSIVSQVNRVHQIKGGIEGYWPEVEFGTTEYLQYAVVDGERKLLRHVDEPPDFPRVPRYRPVMGDVFFQDQIELGDLTLRAGLRADYFDARSTVPSDLSNPANAIAGAPESHQEKTSVKFAVSPRLGVAYPINETLGLHFAYGHFYQFPGIGQAFENADYGKLSRLQAGGISYGVLGNPDIKPEQSVTYEFGIKAAVNPDLGLDASIFYKDIRDLLGVEFVSTYNGAEYARLTNVDFGNVLSFTLAVDRRQVGILSAALDYTWQLAQGNSSDPRETSVRAEAGEDPRPRQVAFNWDQRHTMNATVTLARENQFNVSGVLRVASGQPYTPVIESGFGNGLDTNSGRKPAAMLVDLRGERQLPFGTQRSSLFFRVFNAFDARFFNGGVFASTGSPYYSRFQAADAVQLSDPTRFYAPRRIEFGVSLRSGSES